MSRRNRNRWLFAGLMLGLLVTTPVLSQEAAVETPEAVASEAAEAVTETSADEATNEPPAEADEPTGEPAPEEQPADAEPAAEEATQADDPAPEEASSDEEPADEDEAVEPVVDEPTGVDWGGLFERAPQFIALTHHAAVHLPIALWLFGAFFVVIGWFAPSWRNQIPLAGLIGGMITSVPAVASGWWYAEYEWGSEWNEFDWSDGLVRHRWIGVALLAASLVLTIIALVSQAKQSRGLGFIWRAGLIALAIGVGIEGHIGGELIHGEGFLEEAYEAWVNPDGE